MAKLFWIPKIAQNTFFIQKLIIGIFESLLALGLILIFLPLVP